ncbi:MAG: hypothetical protein CMI18_02565 [Opitutaceae bacterium]|nr:hypothetical protein [Opitutaceae bacterium]
MVRLAVACILVSTGFVTADAIYDRFEILTANSKTASRAQNWKPSEGLVLEVSGMTWTSDNRLAVTIRKGEVWFINNVESDSLEDIEYQLFAQGLLDPLGILEDGDGFLVAQRTELTRLRDTNGDDVADEYLMEASGWNVSGSYHGYTYGPLRDGQGRLWITTNVDMGDLSDNNAAWRGWGLTIEPNGNLTGHAGGMRSPAGLGKNLEGDAFFVDQQGGWMAATPIHHLRSGVFYGNIEGLASQNLPESLLKISAEIPDGVFWQEALIQVPELVPPAVWLPYNKIGRSGTDIQVIDEDGAFGPFDGQLLIGEFSNVAVNRVFLEKVNDEYQGACFQFLNKFPSGVVRLAFGSDSSLYVGMTNRGWSSLGNRAYGLVRVRWNGVTPFEIKEMWAKPDGFELTFTQPVDPASASNLESYQMSNFTYNYQSSYGSEELRKESNRILEAEVSDDRKRVRLKIDGLRELYVHELHVNGVTNEKGEHLMHPEAYYTLNKIPVTNNK